MTDEIWAREEPQSPCVKVCVIHEESGLCMGCYRTRAEIAGWSRMDWDARAALKESLPDRAGQIAPKRRGGRARRR